MSTKKLFTKSAFKVALACPARLWYYHEPTEYANQQTKDEFLLALAEGGFQVGALAKIYCEVDEGCDLEDLKGYDAPLKRTNELLRREKVTIAEAAFRFGNLFIRADILRKDGDQIDLIEVKAKSWHPDNAFLKEPRGGGTPYVDPDIREYIYDVAFQKYVLENAFAEKGMRPQVTAFLMMADKSKVADVGGINQCFKIKKEGKDKNVVFSPEAAALKVHAHVLSCFNVDAICDMICRGEVGDAAEMFRGQSFLEFVDEKSGWYCDHTEQHYAELTPECYKCPFYATEGAPGKDGYEECWMHQAGFRPADFKRPLLEELWGGGNTRQRGNLFQRGKFFLDDVTAEDIGTPSKGSVKSGLDYCQRKILQIGLTTDRKAMLAGFEDNLHDGGEYLDVAGLRAEMGTWKYPLHMIDFETTAVALPFYAKMRPYEQVAFQFSHHIIERAGDDGYRIRHAGQYINTEKGKFPNFEFLRALKAELGKDEGTVFRYAAHENTILNAIRKQLLASEEQDRTELVAFIDTLTHPSDSDREDPRPKNARGVRDMIDLCDIVKRFYYHPLMKGSNSIKAVLPAVLNASKFLQEKYSEPIYGRVIQSLNIPPSEPLTWISKLSDGAVVNPYEKLPDVSAYFPEGMMEDKSEPEEYDAGIDRKMKVNNGGAALTAYSKLQFCDYQMTETLKKALLRYCELDTMAMVFIWEHFNWMVNVRDRVQRI